jgi:hypothetical protein
MLSTADKVQNSIETSRKQRVDKLKQRRDEQLGEADRALGIAQRDERVVAGEDSERAAQGAANVAKAQLGGAAGAGAAALAGLGAAEDARNATFQGALDNARSRKDDFEQKDVDRRKDAADSDINANITDEFNKQDHTDYMSMLDFNKGAGQVQAAGNAAAATTQPNATTATKATADVAGEQAKEEEQMAEEEVTPTAPEPAAPEPEPAAPPPTPEPEPAPPPTPEPAEPPPTAAAPQEDIQKLAMDRVSDALDGFPPDIVSAQTQAGISAYTKGQEAWEEWRKTVNGPGNKNVPKGVLPVGAYKAPAGTGRTYNDSGMRDGPQSDRRVKRNIKPVLSDEDYKTLHTTLLSRRW